MRKSATAFFPEPEPLCRDINAACSYLGIGRTLLYQLIEAGEIMTIKAQSKTLVPTSELHRYVQDRLDRAKASRKADKAAEAASAEV